ncbi:MAG: aspartyl protease family protein [Ignavibacteriaceae bacterium]
MFNKILHRFFSTKRKELQIFSKKVSSNTGIITRLKISNPYDGRTITVKALWDTGCSDSSISSSVVERLRLEPIGDRIQMTSAVGFHWQHHYKVNLNFDNNNFIKNFTVLDFPRVDDVEFLIGMDLILKGRLLIENSSASFCFMVS